MIMSYKNISSNTINRQQTGGIIMTELSRFQKDVEVAATALEMRAENESTSALTVIMSISRLSFAPRQLPCGDIFWRKVWRKRNARIMEHILRKGSVRLWNA